MSFCQVHNHTGKDVRDITENMISDMRYMSKSRRIIDIVRFLELKHKCSLSYHQVYYRFRKEKPLFGSFDCQNLINYLENRDAKYLPVLNDQNQALTKLLFVTNAMRNNYEKFSDILLVDATYNTNIYHIPLLIFSGIANDGRNIVFGMALINDETFETYEWALRVFFEFHNEKLPRVIVTDSDPSLLKAIKPYESEVCHFLCQWHIAKNLTRNFKYLKKVKEDLFDRILALPKIYDKDKAEKAFADLRIIFEENQFQKSKNYLKALEETKEKWCDAFRPLLFHAGVTTTSRAELMNSLVKRYVDRRSEVSSVIEFLEELENLVPSDETAKPREGTKTYHSEIMMQKLKSKLGQLLYSKHYNEYAMYDAYMISNPNLEENMDTTKQYVVYRYGDGPEKVKRLVTWSEEKVECTCFLYFTSGIICRHIFAVSKARVEKDMNRYIHPRWNLEEFKAPDIDSIIEEELQKLILEENKGIKFDTQQEEEKLNMSRVLEKKKAEAESDVESDSEKKDGKSNNPVKNFPLKTSGKGQRKISIITKDPKEIKKQGKREQKNKSKRKDDDGNNHPNRRKREEMEDKPGKSNKDLNEATMDEDHNFERPNLKNPKKI